MMLEHAVIGLVVLVWCAIVYIIIQERRASRIRWAARRESATMWLNVYAGLDWREQKFLRQQIIGQFLILVESKPSEEEFADAVDGLVLMPEMLYALSHKRL